MLQLRVHVKRLNKRRQIPVHFPDRDNIIGEVFEGFVFEGEEVAIVPNPDLGKWYKDRDGFFYWGGGLEITITVKEAFKKDEKSKLGWGLQKLLIEDFWKQAGNKGENIKVAVLDTGISTPHPEFDFTRVRTFNVLTNSNSAEDTSGHGSHVAGILAAQGTKVSGAAPGINLLIIKVAEGSEVWRIENVVAGIQHAINERADIISISAEFDEGNSKLESLRKKVEEAERAGIVVVASAGNNFNSFPVESFPAAFDVCISVGSIKEDGLRADSSTHSTKLDVVAPGEQILSTWIGGGYKIESGTSMATPLVAGVISILKSFAKTKFNRNLTPSEIQVILNKSSDDAGEKGFDTSYGFGIINPLNALKLLTN